MPYTSSVDQGNILTFISNEVGGATFVVHADNEPGDRYVLIQSANELLEGGGANELVEVQGTLFYLGLLLNADEPLDGQGNRVQTARRKHCVKDLNRMSRILLYSFKRERRSGHHGENSSADTRLRTESILMKYFSQ